MTCQKCGQVSGPGLRFCSRCGHHLSSNSSHAFVHVPSNPIDSSKLIYPKNPPISPYLCFLNLLIGGIAQMIHGQILKGITLLLSQWLVGTWFFGLGNIAICIVGIIDAYKVGKVLQSGRAIKKWQWFPS